MGALHERLRTIPDPKERARVKAQAISEADHSGAVIKHGSYRVVLASPVVAVGAAVRFSVVVMRGNQDVTPPDLNPITVHNPPILVPDPAGEVERVFPATSLGPERRERYREDVTEALRQIVADLIRQKVG